MSNKKCKNININKVANECNLGKAKKVCDKNYKNILLKKKQNEKKFFKDFLHIFYKKYNNTQLNLEEIEEKKILNKIDKLNNKLYPKYTLRYINIDGFITINMHIIDFFTDPLLYKFMAELNIYMEIVEKKIRCSDKMKEYKELCKKYNTNEIDKNCMNNIICVKNKYLINFILDKILTLDLYKLVSIILLRLNESFTNKPSYNEYGIKYYLFRINGDELEVDFHGLTSFIYGDLLPFLDNNNCNYIVKLIINIIIYYIDDLYRNRDSIKLIIKKRVDEIKIYSTFVGYLPKCSSLDIFKKELRTYTNTFITNDKDIIDIGKLNFWYDIPKIFIKILSQSIFSSAISGEIRC